VLVDDVAANGYTIDRAMIRQRKTGRPIRFESTEQTHQCLDEYLRLTARKAGDFLFAGRGTQQFSFAERTTWCVPKRPTTGPQLGDAASCARTPMDRRRKYFDAERRAAR
jgi:hypothetical protein